MAISVRPVSAALGAEVFGVDPSRPPTDEEFRAIRRALLEHLVIVIPDLPPDVRWFLDLTRRFGRLMPHILDQYHHPETPEISVIRANADDALARRTEKPAGAFWHSDQSYERRPSDASFLYGLEIPSRGGDTCFANLYRAYEALSERLKRRVEGLRAIHRWGWRGLGASPELTPGQRAAHPDAEHPVVRIHPETGRRALFVNPGFTVGIVGMEEAESAALLAELFEHALDPTFQYRHGWRRGDLVGMDNRASMHCAVPDYTEPRTLYRMIVGCTDPAYTSDHRE